VSASGLPLHVETGGLGPGAGVDTYLLLHGYGASMFTWRHWAPRLAERGHVVQVDLKGHGRAPRPDDGRYAPHDQAELVLALTRERDLGNLTLVGHSLGGGVALLAALGMLEHRPDCLRRLVLVASAAYAQRMPPVVTLARYPNVMARLLRAVGPELLVSGVLRTIVHDRATVDTEQVRGYAAPLRTNDTVRTLACAARQILPPDLDRITLRYPEIHVPALLIWGRQDRVVPLTVGERLARALPDARLHVLDRCGHLPAEELPEESWKVLEGFLDERKATA
jgi:pimeloyl-ACP methyl ester carboxylesterase